MGGWCPTSIRHRSSEGCSAPLLTRRRSSGKPRSGNRVPTEISTSYAERSNLTMRMASRRFTRLTNGFSKKLENHAAAVSLYVAHYSLCRWHESIRSTPAEAIGLADHAWSIGELLDGALAVATPDPPPQVPGEAKHQKWLSLHDEAFDRSKEEFAKHFKTKYSGENPPIWIAAEIWDFGAMSFLYAGMRKADQAVVSKVFAVDLHVLETWLRSINVARNICAHHSRFWNKPNAARPAWPKASDCPDLGHIEKDTNAKARVYGLACMCAHLLRAINPRSSWCDRFKKHIATFPSSTVVSISSAGFPTDWEKANLWN